MTYMYRLLFTENRGLKLFVSLHNDPAEPSIIPAHLCPNNFDPSSDIDNIFESNKEKYYLVGNITFSCMTNRSNDTLYFKYKFGDGETEPYTLSSDFTTHTYGKAGVYNYTVDAVAVTESSKAFHAAHSGQIRVLGKEYCSNKLDWNRGIPLITSLSPDQQC